MDTKGLRKIWSTFLIDADVTNADIATGEGVTRSAISQRILNGSIRFVDFVNIIERYGYTIKIVKKE